MAKVISIKAEGWQP